MKNTIKITCGGCFHGVLPELPTQGGDLLILTGDYTPNDSVSYWNKFFEWLKRQKYTKKVLISGNHDNFLHITDTEKIKSYIKDLEKSCGFEYLCNSGTSFQGLKIWGTPHSNWFDRINPQCTAFVRKENELDAIYAQIPEQIDILISHQPFYGVNDEDLGSKVLKKHVERVNPKLFVCSHIHEGYGVTEYQDIKCINCSIMSKEYSADNEPITIEL